MRSDRGPWKDPNILKVGSYLKLSAVLLYFETLFHSFFLLSFFLIYSCYMIICLCPDGS
jgi:hypothetical protein